MIKLIVSDLDGTLLQEDNTVKQDDRESLKEALQDGFQISIATGRMDIEIQEVLKSIGERFHRISQNGAFTSTVDNQAIFSKTFDPSLARKIYNKVRPLNVITLLCNYDTNFTEENNEYVEGIQKRMFHPIVIDPKLTDKFESIMPSKITLLGFENDIIKIYEELAAEHGEEIDIYISEKQVLDIMPKKISKGNALSKLLDYLEIKEEEIACIGDSFNDIPMFKLTPYSYVISHAHDSVKKEASFVVNSVSDAVAQIRRENMKLVK
ncbi:HAD family hydrolase [Ferdinandcohnia quinoae]|uniref:HAD family hydrolase n=1 Tax=Fredinandcohnia quinoae TaxID=2918902 RepID=A0AAW5E5C1_9BACI|nr:HAD family hydrolase [Fredinandcohnia sp. SECRCQ15]MCH1623979.1 HAD family hydrolase [Fredinandcohnia sp. SECRCQ15]